MGKTTTTNALAVVLRSKGYRVLCIDFDPQGNLSFSLQADNTTGRTIYHVLKGEWRMRQAIQHTPLCDVVPCDVVLSGIELEFTGSGREFLLRERLAPVLGQYDYVLIDTPPGLGFLTINALTAADAVLVPVLTDLFSLQGILQLADTVEHVRDACNPQLHIAGILLVRYTPREELSSIVRDTAQMLGEKLQVPVLQTCIRSSVVVTKAQVLRQDITKYAPKNMAVQDYIRLADELLERGL